MRIRGGQIVIAVMVGAMLPSFAFAHDYDCPHTGRECTERCERHHRESFNRNHKNWSREGENAGKNYGENTTQFNNGQRNGFKGNSGNLGGLADTMGSLASRYEALSRSFAKSQQEIVRDSTTRTPGPDAQTFSNNSNGGQSRISNFENPTDPEVKKQVEAYDKIGDLRRQADEQAQKFRAKEAEMKALAAKNDKNADKLDNSKQQGGGGGSPGGGDQKGQGNPDSTIATKNPNSLTDPEATPKDKIKDPIAENNALDTNNPKNNSKSGSSESRSPASVASSSPTAPKFTGSSTQDLRDRLSQKLSAIEGGAASASAKGSGGGAGGMGGFGGSDSGDAKTAGKDGSASDNAANMAGGNKGGGGGYGSSDDVLSPFGKPLSDQKMALAGSETDSSIKGIVSELAGNGAEGQGASGEELNYEEGIGEKNSPSLFERTHSKLTNCAEKSCVKGGRGHG